MSAFIRHNSEEQTERKEVVFESGRLIEATLVYENIVKNIGRIDT